ncbi:hypothetical protein BH23CHL1_BH23CHL1_08320 [soil metagenome]
MQRDTERDPTPTWQQGNLVAAQQLVGSLQGEALYVSFLLTGDRQAAIALAETGFLELFEHTRTSELDSDARTRLLLLIGKSFLKGDYTERIERDAPAGLFADPGPTRYGVDNRRTLLLAALGRLNDRERVGLVLGDLSGLDSSTLNTLLERRNEPLAAPMETARQRVRQSVDLPAGEPLRSVLVEATFDAPKINLWLRLEAPLTEIQRRQKQQSQFITYGIVGAVLLVLVVGIAVLFGDGLLNGSEAEGSSSGSAASEETTAIPTEPAPTLAPPVFAPESTPTPSLPAANVPGWFLLETIHEQVDSPNGFYRSVARYDPEQNQIQNLFVNEIRLADGSSVGVLSPDGYQLVLFREEPGDDQTRFFVSSYGTNNVGLQWETELLTVDENPSTDPSLANAPRLASAIADDRVYAAVLTTDNSPTLTIHALFQRNGKPRGTLEIDLPELTVDSRTYQGNIHLYAPPDSKYVYLFLENFGDPGKGRQIRLFTIDRMDMTKVNEQGINADPEQEFWFWGARPTVDGGALYGLQQDRGGSQTRVQFIDFQTGERTIIELPFTPLDGYPNATLASVLSHDGQRMYVIDQNGASVAIINLAERRLERTFPLDRGDFVSRFDGGDEYLFGYAATLSADGSQIYVAAPEQGSFQNSDAWQSGVWVIDATTWRIAAFIPIEGFVDAIHLALAEATIYVQVRVPSDSGQTIEMVRMTSGNAKQIVDRLQIPSNDSNRYWPRSPADLYRSQYSRSPAIDGVKLTDSELFSTLPRLEVTTGRAVVAAGQQATVEVRVLDPASGNVLTSDQQDVRFTSTAGVTAIVESPNGDRQFLVLGQVEPGVYRGSVTVQDMGRWTVDVAVSNADGQAWVSPRIGQIDVVPTFIGSDGRAYLFELSTEPEQPVVNENTTVRLRLIDAQTGEPMPETITLAIAQDALDNATLSDLPERIDIRFFQGQQGVQTAMLQRVSNGAYEGVHRFWSSGPITSTILIQPEGQRQITIPANTIEVGFE